MHSVARQMAEDPKALCARLHTTRALTYSRHPPQAEFCFAEACEFLGAAWIRRGHPPNEHSGRPIA